MTQHLDASRSERFATGAFWDLICVTLLKDMR